MASESGKGFGPWWLRLCFVCIALIVLIVVLWVAFWKPVRHEEVGGAAEGASGVVAGPITYVTARVAGVVQSVAVENDQHVEQGALLVELDSAPLKAAVNQRQAELQVAEADLEQSRAQVRAQAAAAVADWYSIIKQRDQLRQDVAQLRSNIASLKLRQAELRFADSQYQRAVQLAKQRVITADEMEQKQAAMKVAEQQVQMAEAEVQEARASVGLDPSGDDASVPAEWERKFAAIRMALFHWAQGLAAIGFPIKLNSLEPYIEPGPKSDTRPSPEFQHKLDEWIETSPAMRVADAKVAEAQARLHAAQLELEYAGIRAPVAGTVELRNVHPGEAVDVAQKLLVIRPPGHLWIDGRIPQAELEQYRVGQSVAVRGAAFGSRTLHGRVTSVGSSTDSAGGARLPVRIELGGDIPSDTPLVAGLSVELEAERGSRAEPVATSTAENHR